MEEGLDKHLGAFSELIRGEEDIDDETFEQERLEALERAAEDTKTNIETQEQVFELQEAKRAVMERLHQQLRSLDDSSAEIADFGRTVAYNEATNTYKVFGKGGTTSDITLGEVLTGGEWGQRYRLDGSVPRGVRKRFYVTEARRQLMDLYDLQIAKTGAASWYNQTSGNSEAYAAIANRAEQVPTTEQSPSIVAEKMVLSLMTRLTYDANLPFEVFRADARADVEDKIDFIIHVPSNKQGVRVETKENAHDVGIQFTTDTRAETREYKLTQTKRATRQLKYAGDNIEKVVLVTIPVKHVRKILSRWQQKEKKAIGGPDKLLSEHTQERIFKGVLHDVFSERTVDAMWQKVSGELLEEKRAV